MTALIFAILFFVLAKGEGGFAKADLRWFRTPAGEVVRAFVGWA